MEQHTVIGERICGPTPILVAMCCRHSGHHERRTAPGTGRLKGRTNPLNRAHPSVTDESTTRSLTTGPIARLSLRKSPSAIIDGEEVKRGWWELVSDRFNGTASCANRPTSVGRCRSQRMKALAASRIGQAIFAAHTDHLFCRSRPQRLRPSAFCSRSQIMHSRPGPRKQSILLRI